MSGVAITSTVADLKKSPRDRRLLSRLNNACSDLSKEQFKAGFRDKDLAAMLYVAASQIVSRWEDEAARWKRIKVANALRDALLNPKPMPKRKRVRPRTDQVDVKKRAAGDDL